VRSENILSAEMGRRLKIDGLEEAEERMLWLTLRWMFETAVGDCP
jgi:hypothetical protein